MPPATLPTRQAASSLPIVTITAVPSHDDGGEDVPNKVVPFVIFGAIALVTLVAFFLYLMYVPFPPTSCPRHRHTMRGLGLHAVLDLHLPTPPAPPRSFPVAPPAGPGFFIISETTGDTTPSPPLQNPTPSM